MNTETDRPEPDRRVWLITGCSTGFGDSLARAALETGDLVVATARNAAALDALAAAHPQTCLPVAMDVGNGDSVADAVAKAVAWKGRIDVLVNNAGYGLVGAIEELDDKEIHDIFDTNVIGVVRVSRGVLPLMRERGRGMIVNISSMGGLVGFAGMGAYSASKFAVEGLSEALALEAKPLGIDVLLVEPGPFRTPFRGRLRSSARQLAAYQDTVGKVRGVMADTTILPPGDPQRAARAIVQAATADAPPRRLLLGKVCYDNVTNKLNAMKEEIATWRDLGIATDFPS